MSLESESWLAATGVITPNATRPSPDRVAELPLRLTNRVTRWLKGTEVGPWAPPKAHDPAKLRERFAHAPGELPGAHELGDVLGAEWVQEVNEARQSLLERWPGIPLRGGLTALEPPLSHDQAQDWLGLVAIVEDASRLCDELEAGALLPAELELFGEVYPSLMEVVVEAAFKAVVDLAARGTDLPEAKERMLRLVLGTPEDQPIVVAQGEGPPPPRTSTGGGGAKSAADDLQTVAQKSGT